MKTLIVSLAAVALAAVSFTGCRKDFRGVCRCKYLSGDKKEFDYSQLTIEHAKAKCDSTDNNAEAFAGDCRLE